MAGANWDAGNELVRDGSGPGVKSALCFLGFGVEIRKEARGWRSEREGS